MADSFSTIILSSWRSCSMRQSMFLVRPLANVRRSRATVCAMSEDGFAATCCGAATDSVVMMRPSGPAMTPILTNRLTRLFGGDEGVDERPRPARCLLYRTTQALELTGGLDRPRAPSVCCEPVGTLGPDVVVIPQLKRVKRDVLAARFALGPRLSPLLLDFSPRGFVDTEHFDRDMTTRPAQSVDRGEHRLLRLARQERQQPLGKPRRRHVGVEAGGAQGGRPIMSEV